MGFQRGICHLKCPHGVSVAGDSGLQGLLDPAPCDLWHNPALGWGSWPHGADIWKLAHCKDLQSL